MASDNQWNRFLQSAPGIAVQIGGGAIFCAVATCWFVLSAIGRMEGPSPIGFGGLFLIAVVAAVVGAGLASALVFRDRVKQRVDAGRPVSAPARLFFAAGIVSLAIWFVGIFVGVSMLSLGWIMLTAPDQTVAQQPNAPIPSAPSDTPSASPIAPPPVPPPPPDIGPDPTDPPGDSPRTPTDPLADTPIPPAPPIPPPPTVNPIGEPPERPIRPLVLDSETSPKEAYAQFVERYGAEKVARIVLRLDAPQAGMEAMLRARLFPLLGNSQPPSIYVSAQDKTAAVILAPLADIEALAADFPLGEVTQVQVEQRLVYAKLPADGDGLAAIDGSQPPSQPAPPEDSSADVERLLAEIQGGDLRASSAAFDTLSALGTPEAAEALAGLLATKDRGRATFALRKMGAVAQDAVLGQAQSSDRSTSSAALGVLREIGTAEILPQLQRLARSRDRATAATAQFTIQAIQRRE